MIIDAHAHWGPWFFSMQTGSLQLNIDLIDRFGIDLQIVSAIEAIVYHAPSGNAALERALDEAGDDRIRGQIAIDPRDLGAARADLERYTGPRWVGAKIHTHYSATPIASPAMEEAVRLATGFGLPVLIHTWGVDVLDLADLAARVPGARLIAGHMGAMAWRLVPEAAKRSDRIWFEPCWSAPEAGRIRHVVDEVGSERVIFGTDATLIDPAVTMGAVRAAALDEDAWAAVMGGNAERLFGLK